MADQCCTTDVPARNDIAFDQRKWGGAAPCAILGGGGGQGAMNVMTSNELFFRDRSDARRFFSEGIIPTNLSSEKLPSLLGGKKTRNFYYRRIQRVW